MFHGCPSGDYSGSVSISPYSPPIRREHIFGGFRLTRYTQQQSRTPCNNSPSILQRINNASTIVTQVPALFFSENSAVLQCRHYIGERAGQRNEGGTNSRIAHALSKHKPGGDRSNIRIATHTQHIYVCLHVLLRENLVSRI